MSKVIAIIGQKRRGKSTRTKELIIASGKPTLIYDVNGEYGVANVPDMGGFFENAKKATGKTVVFEEATIFFVGNSMKKQMLELLVRARHTGNTYILVFHSLSDCPNYVLRLCDWLVLFATQDSWTYVKTAFNGLDKVLEAFIDVKKNSENNYHYKTEIELN